MRSCLITGSGRSGTSMVAGTMAGAGYFMGHQLHRPREGNPKGFFEDATINAINEDLLEDIAVRRPRGPFSRFFQSRPTGGGTRWLAQVPLRARVDVSSEVAASIRKQVEQAPFAFKDPRFCYTLPGWRPFLPPDTLLVCVFREPARTVNSILKECAEVPYLQGVRMTYRAGMRLWTIMYRHILDLHQPLGRWVFLHYDQVLDGSGLLRLEEALDASLDRSFADGDLRRSDPDGPVSRRAIEVYTRLCELAGYRP